MDVGSARRDPRLQKFWRWFDENHRSADAVALLDEMKQKTLYPEELDDKRTLGEEGLVIVDTRSESAFTMHHIPGSVHVALDAMVGAELPIERSQMVVLVCDVGQTSLFAGIYLQKNGFERVASLDGGINAWIASGYEVERG